MPDEPLRGRVAFVTGAGRGQGRAHALGLARAGAAIVALDVPGPIPSVGYALGTEEDLRETVRLVEAEGGEAIATPADVRDRSAVEAAVGAALERFGGLDIVIANAGIVSQGKLWELTDEAWDAVVATTLRERRWGRIVVTSSMGGRMGLPDLSHYVATKWGVIGLAKSLAFEVARDGITVNVVCPCTVATPMVLDEEKQRLVAEGGPEADAFTAPFTRVNLIRQPWIQAEDVTRAVLHLVTDPGVLTGTVLEVGLGSSARAH
jgi:NAD(P)-dependent dehydrogenase (short-subunit alcohol dehydrogenase family)